MNGCHGLRQWLRRLSLISSFLIAPHPEATLEILQFFQVHIQQVIASLSDGVAAGTIRGIPLAISD
jgi:hypothetical protein